MQEFDSSINSTQRAVSSPENGIAKGVVIALAILIGGMIVIILAGTYGQYLSLKQ